MWGMAKLPLDVQRTKESSDACQRSSSSRVGVFKAFPPAMAGERHDRAARGGIFGGAVQVVDGVLSGGQMGGVWRRNDLAMTKWLRGAERLRGAELLRLDLCLLRWDHSW